MSASWGLPGAVLAASLSFVILPRLFPDKLASAAKTELPGYFPTAWLGYDISRFVKAAM